MLMQIMQTNLENFNKESFEEWLLNKKRQTKWNDNLRYQFILWIMVKFEYDNEYDLTSSDFYKTKNGVGDFNRIWNVQYVDYKLMIIDVVKRIVNKSLDYGLFKMSEWDKRMEIHKEHEDLLRQTPIYPTTNDDVVNIEQTRAQIADTSNMVDKLTSNLTGCEIHVDENTSFGGVYIMYIKDTGQIAYVGSSNSVKRRKQSHISQSLLNSNHRMSKYCNSNNVKLGEDIKVMVIAKCPLGLEMFVEAAFYDELSKHYKLCNGVRPVRTTFTIDSTIIIYAIVDESRDKKELYMGSTYNIHDRYSNHKTHCYGKSKVDETQENSRTEKLYVEIRRMNDTCWPDHVKMIPIEKCNVCVRSQRENHWIEYYDLINNGYNSCLAEDQTNGSGDVKCRFCDVTVKMGGIARHEKSCEKNPKKIGKEFKCTFCNKEFLRKDTCNDHSKRCKQNPVNIDPEKIKLEMIKVAQEELKRKTRIRQNPLQNVSYNETQWEASNRPTGSRRTFNHKKHGGVEHSLKAALEFRVNHLKQTGNNLTAAKHSNGFDPAWQVDVSSTPVDEVVDILLQRYRSAVLPECEAQS